MLKQRPREFVSCLLGVCPLPVIVRVIRLFECNSCFIYSTMLNQTPGSICELIKFRKILRPAQDVNLHHPDWMQRNWRSQFLQVLDATAFPKP